MQILGCYNSTPLKMNLVLEIRTMMIKEMQILCLWILLYFAYLLTLLQVTCQTNSKILTDTPTNTQVSPITRSPFLFSPYYQISFFICSPSNGASLLSWSKVGSITNFKTLMTIYAEVKLLNSQTQFLVHGVVRILLA